MFRDSLPVSSSRVPHPQHSWHWGRLCNNVSVTDRQTPWSGVLLEKLTSSQLVMQFPALYGTRTFIRLRLKCEGTRAETIFRLFAKRASPFKSTGASVQSTTGSWGVRISGSNAGYTMFRGSVKGTGYPLHSPVSRSLPLPCVTVCHHVSTGLYHIRKSPPAVLVMNLIIIVIIVLLFFLLCCQHYPSEMQYFNPLNHELNPICYLLALLGAHHFLHVNRIRVKLLTFRLLMSYIYIYIYMYIYIYIWSTHSSCF